MALQIKNGRCVWDFMFLESHTNIEELFTTLKKECKKWTFQLEKEQKNEQKYYHGRISLKKRLRAVQTKELFSQFKGDMSITSTENINNNFYLLKPETRIEGPWSNTQDNGPYIHC